MNGASSHSCAEIERSLLGALILDPERLPEARETLRIEDFESPGHRLVFEAILAIADAQAGLDLRSVATWLTAERGIEPRKARSIRDLWLHAALSEQ